MKSDVISEETFDTKLITTTQVSQVLPHTPEGAETLSPGQRPGLLRMIAYRPVRAKALKQNIYSA